MKSGLSRRPRLPQQVAALVLRDEPGEDEEMVGEAVQIGEGERVERHLA